MNAALELEILLRACSSRYVGLWEVRRAWEASSLTLGQQVTLTTARAEHFKTITL